jgi:nicotinate-nucleotide adenylyltransferase
MGRSAREIAAYASAQKEKLFVPSAVMAGLDPALHTPRPPSLDARLKAGHDPQVSPRDTHYRLPPFVPGLKVGLFGGSFNPPHEGHRAASLLALRRLKLDRIWWLVTPNNPLKDARDLAPLAQRLEAARKIANHPRIEVTAIEAAIGATYSFETVSYLKRRCAGVRFVWIMGADNFRYFDRWQRWGEIAKLVPIAIIDRPGCTLVALSGRAALTTAHYRLDETRASRLATYAPPAFVFLHGPRSEMSSTELRSKVTL